MNLNITYDANTLNNAPADFFNAVNYVVNLFDSTFGNNATVNIEIGYGTFPYDNSVVPALGESIQNNLAAVSYGQAAQQLMNEGAPGSSTLPSTAPISGSLTMGSAQEKALGLIGSSNSLDGWVGIASNAAVTQQTGGAWSFSPTATPGPGQYYIVGTLEHEITEVMGRISYLDAGGEYGLIDLYRYAGQGVRQTGTGDASYFSINGGATNLASWNNFRISSEDLGDWAAHAGPSRIFTSAGADAFNAFSNPGLINGLSQTDITLMDALGWSPVAGTVAELYMDVLGRAPDPAGLAGWNSALANGQSLQDIRNVFANSAEAQGDLTQIYNQVLGRAPDAGGLSGWTNALANGDTIVGIRNAFAHSQEAQNDLNQIYQQVLGRAADNGGLLTYTNDLAAGGSLQQIRSAAAHSTEAQNDVNSIYQQVLGRNGDSGGLASYEDALAGGATLAGIHTGMAHSAEAQADLTRLFDGILHRDPNAAELAGAENRLDSGATLQAVQHDLAAVGSAGAFIAITAPSGDAILNAAPAPTEFVFNNVNFGRDTILGFDPSQDAIVLDHTQLTDFSAATAHASAIGAGTLIALGPTQSIALNGVPLSSLNPSNLQFV